MVDSLFGSPILPMFFYLMIKQGVSLQPLDKRPLAQAILDNIRFISLWSTPRNVLTR